MANHLILALRTPEQCEKAKDRDTSMDILGIYKEVWAWSRAESLQSSSSLEGRGSWPSKSGRTAAAPRLSPRGRRGPVAPWESCLGHKEQLLYSRISSPCRFSWAWASAQAQFIISLSLQFPQFTSKFFLSFLAEILGKKNLVEAIFLCQVIITADWSMGGLAFLEARVSTLVSGSLISKQTRFLVME